jgi:DNA mismatch repair protein MLH1
MLLEYFSISISPEGNLLALPQLIPKYIPPLENLPMFLLNLCVNVDWSDEQPCLGGIARQLAEFYALPIISSEEELENPSFLDPKNTNSRPWILENMIFPALRSDFTPLKSFSSDGTIVQVACLEKLYKVFERC